MVGSRLDQPQGWFFRDRMLGMREYLTGGNDRLPRTTDVANLPINIREFEGRSHRARVLGPAFLVGIAVGALAYFASGSPVLAFAAGSVTIPATVFLVEHFHLE